MGLGYDIEVALGKLAELAETCHQQQLPGHRDPDNAERLGGGVGPINT